ncbi:hypothetical protein TD95_003791 [Thielaviopsis punctulata]|uniref:beta-glucosidase n=1 Tax=Thielaviopsis punctulata TaxID=72032 RepID=A0A0F4ZFQ0_9PEZI|nr:hypothetical protein TD95_003791 [Thielaviopsis punctulata]
MASTEGHSRRSPGSVISEDTTYTDITSSAFDGYRNLVEKSSKDYRVAAEKVLKTLTLEEKVSLLTAADFWRTSAIPNKNVPSIKTSDGPNGARGSVFVGGTKVRHESSAQYEGHLLIKEKKTKAALFPCGISLAASWNKSLLYEVGQHLAEEAKARSANVLLAPTVCLHRHPLGGRNFESFSEDPLLTGKLAVNYIKGLQSGGVAATIKHFVGNEQETNRFTINDSIPERALRELYLKPFEIAIREANPWVLMTAYNSVNGKHCDMNDHTLKDILHGEWGYKGTVISDWGGINSTVDSVLAGCDIEFPHSDKWRLSKLVSAVKEGRVPESAIDTAALNVLTLISRLKGTDMSPENPERESNCPETRTLIRTAAVEGLTLLKNEGDLLPLDPVSTTVAVIGPNANRAIAGGGGSASLNPYYTTIPLESIKAVSKKDVLFAQGCHIFKWLPVASRFCTTDTGEQGVKLEWFRGDQFKGKPVVVQYRKNTDLFLWDSAPLEDVGPEWSAIATTRLTPTTSGEHTLSFSSVGPGRLFVDGAKTVDLWDWTEEGEAMFEGSADQLVTLHMTAGKPIEIRVEITNEVRPASKKAQFNMTHRYGGCRIGFKQEDKVDYLQQAVEVAKKVDVAILVVGLDAEWESEGYDRKTMDLPVNGSQDRLVEAVLAANPRTIVVNQSGSPVTMPWADRVPVILQAWYQGQEAGNALADVLFGIKSPSGKLPCSWPKRLQDTPALHTWPGENLVSIYGEGLYIGYRHYEHAEIAPLFPFGHGLSYTTFEYGRPELSSRTLMSKSVIELTMAVSNTGRVDGAETIQFYVRDVESRLPRPVKELAAFEKVSLKSGETKHFRVALDKHAVGYYDTWQKAWVAEQGIFEVLIGASSVDIRQSAKFTVEETFTWVF